MQEVETISEALARLRVERGEARTVHFYVTDPAGRLVGVAPVRRLLLADPATLVGEIMVHPVHSVREDTRFGDALEVLAAQRLLALPVVDREGRLTAVLDVSDTTRALSLLERQDSERKLFQTLGVSAGRKRRALIASLLVGLVLAAIVGQFQRVIPDSRPVMLFVPLVLSVATASAICAVTEAVEHLKWTKVGREFRTGRFKPSAAATAGAVAAGIVAGTWQRSIPFAFTVALSLVVAMLAGVSLGSLGPRLINRWRLDPKLAAGPIVTAVANAVALSCYLALCIVLPRR